MAKDNDSEQDFESRYRILGAIVLVTLAFIVFSVVLKEQPQQLNSDQKQTAVAPDTRVVVTPIPSTRTASGTPTSPVASIPSKPRIIDNPLAPETKPAPKPKPVPRAEIKPKPVSTSTPVPAVKAPAKPTGDRWTVQVGTFANLENARRLRARLQKQKYQVTLKTISINSGRAVRVRVGPFGSKADAVRARDRIRKNNGIDGVVLAMK